MRIPLVITSELWHIGDLDNNTQGQRQSFEGNLFSASACPNAWEGIARLGGGKYYCLEQETMLVNLTQALYETAYEPLRLTVQQWAMARRLIEPGVIYVVSYYDDESECEREVHFETKAEAQDEYGEDEEIEVRQTFLATDALLKLHGFRRDSASVGLEYALIEWIREQMVGASMVKGVYWDERLDELALSAPRAGMFSTKGFKVQEYLPDDDECLARVDFMDMERYATRAVRFHDHSGLSL